MMEISEAEIKLSNIFTKLTGYVPVSVVDMGDVAVFLVHRKALPKVIGKEGRNIEALSKRLGKRAYVFADAESLEEFVRNLFNNVRILDIEVVDIMGEKTVSLLISEKDKAKALGKAKARLRAAKELLRRKFNADLNLRTKVVA